jgi:hypothetical protein
VKKFVEKIKNKQECWNNAWNHSIRPWDTKFILLQKVWKSQKVQVTENVYNGHNGHRSGPVLMLACVLGEQMIKLGTELDIKDNQCSTWRQSQERLDREMTEVLQHEWSCYHAG